MQMVLPVDVQYCRPFSFCLKVILIINILWLCIYHIISNQFPKFGYNIMGLYTNLNALLCMMILEY